MINRIPRTKTLSTGAYWPIDENTIALFDGSFDNLVSGSTITAGSDNNMSIDSDGAFIFGGTDSRFAIDLDSVLSDNYTIEFLISGESGGFADQCFFGNGGYSAPRADHFYYDDVGKIGVGGALSDNPGYPNADTWFVFSLDVYGSTSRHYCDGLPVASFGNISLSDPLPFGWDGGNSGRYFKGKIKAIRISNIARYQGDVFTPPSFGALYIPPDYSGYVIVSGSGYGAGAYPPDGTYNGKYMWSKPGTGEWAADCEIKYDGSGKWQIFGDPWWMGSNEVIYEVSSTADIPPSSGWTVHSNWVGMAEPAPSSVDLIGDSPNYIGYTYANKSFDMSNEETTPQSLFFSSDGTKMYVIGVASDTVYQYTPSTAWDIETASYANKSFGVSGQDETPQSLFFSSDGTKMYVLGGRHDTIYQYTLSTAWDIETASYANKSFDVNTQENAPYGLSFSSDGAKMYVIGVTGDTVYQYTLSTAWDIETASYANKSFGVSGQDTYPRDLSFNSDGTKMYIVGDSTNTVYQYALSTAWDIETASYADKSLNVGGQDAAPQSLFFSADETKMYVIGSVAGAVYQYD